MNTTGFFTKLFCIGLFVAILVFGLTSNRNHAAKAAAAAPQNQSASQPQHSKKQKRQQAETQAKAASQPKEQQAQQPGTEPSGLAKAWAWLKGEQLKPWSSTMKTVDYSK